METKEEKKCIVCEEVFVTKNTARKTCSRNCSRIYRRAYMKAYWRAYHQKPEVKAHYREYMKKYNHEKKEIWDNLPEEKKLNLMNKRAKELLNISK